MQRNMGVMRRSDTLVVDEADLEVFLESLERATKHVDAAEAIEDAADGSVGVDTEMREEEFREAEAVLSAEPTDILRDTLLRRRTSFKPDDESDDDDDESDDDEEPGERSFKNEEPEEEESAIAYSTASKPEDASAITAQRVAFMLDDFVRANPLKFKRRETEDSKLELTVDDPVGDLAYYTDIVNKSWSQSKFLTANMASGLDEFTILRAAAVVYLIDKRITRFKNAVAAAYAEDDIQAEIERLIRWFNYKAVGDPFNRAELLPTYLIALFTRNGTVDMGTLNKRAVRNFTRHIQVIAGMNLEAADTNDPDAMRRIASTTIVGPFVAILTPNSLPAAIRAGATSNTRTLYTGGAIIDGELAAETAGGGGGSTFGAGPVGHYMRRTKIHAGNARATRYITHATPTHVTVTQSLARGGTARRHAWAEYESELREELAILVARVKEEALRTVVVEVPRSYRDFYAAMEGIQAVLAERTNLVHTHTTRHGRTAASAKLASYKAWSASASMNILQEGDYATFPPFTWRARTSFVVQVEDHGALVRIANAFEVSPLVSVHLDMIGDYRSLLEAYPGAVTRATNNSDDHFMVLAFYLREQDNPILSVEEEAFKWADEAVADAVFAAAELAADTSAYLEGLVVTRRLADMLRVV